MNNEFTKKAVEMLLKGATMLKEPCPYCSGVRIMKDGHALCVNCGKEPQTREEKMEKSNSSPSLNLLEKKLESLSKELEEEKDHGKQQNILKSINSLIETIQKLKNKQ